MDHSVIELLNILDKRNYEKHCDWRELGMILFNIDTNLLSSFVEFTDSLCDRENKDCDKLWRRATKDIQKSYVSCLFELIKRDNYDGYIKYFSDYISKKYSVTEINEDIPLSTCKNIVYDIFGGSIFYYEGVWYEFRDHRWQIRDKNDVWKDIFVVIEKIFTELDTRQMEHFNKIFRPNICLDDNRFFRKSGFTEIFDANTNLLGFKNGVYDIKEKYFRMGYPSDYINKSTGYSYVEFDSEGAAKLYKLLSPIKNRDEIREFYCYAYKCLTGGDNSVDIWYGKPGKSVLCLLLCKLLGEYSCVRDLFLHSKKYLHYKASEIPYVKNASVKGCRLVISEENEYLSHISPFHTKRYLREIFPVKMETILGGDYVRLDSLNSDTDAIYANDPYGKQIFNKKSSARAVISTRDAFEKAKITPAKRNILLIEHDEPTYNIGPVNKVEFRQNVVRDNNFYQNTDFAELGKILMWYLLNRTESFCPQCW